MFFNPYFLKCCFSTLLALNYNLILAFDVMLMKEEKKDRRVHQHHMIFSTFRRGKALQNYWALLWCWARIGISSPKHWQFDFYVNVYLDEKL